MDAADAAAVEAPVAMKMAARNGNVVHAAARWRVRPFRSCIIGTISETIDARSSRSARADGAR